MYGDIKDLKNVLLMMCKTTQQIDMALEAIEEWKTSLISKRQEIESYDLETLE